MKKELSLTLSALGAVISGFVTCTGIFIAVFLIIKYLLGS